MIRYATCHIGDEEILVGYLMAPSEPDVGLMRDYIDDLWIENGDGTMDTTRMRSISEIEWEKLRQQIYDQID